MTFNIFMSFEQPFKDSSEIKSEEVKKEKTIRTSFETNGENFFAERLINPEDPRIEQIQKLLESHFGKDELDPPEVMKRAMTGKMETGEKIPPYLVNVVENSKGEVKGVSTGAVVETVDEEGNPSEKSGVALGCYFLTSPDVRGRLAIPRELFKLQELSAKQDAESRGLEVKGYLAEAQNDVERLLNTRGSKRLYIQTQEGYKELPYEQPPLDWNPKTGKPEKGAGIVPEHLMLRLSSGENRLPSQELMEMVRGMYYYNNYREEGYFKTARAYETHTAFIKKVEKKLADSIGGKQVHLLNRKEREAMMNKGIQFLEHETSDLNKEARTMAIRKKEANGLTKEQLAEVEALEKKIDEAILKGYDSDDRRITVSIPYPLNKLRQELARRYRKAGWHITFHLDDGRGDGDWVSLT